MDFIHIWARWTANWMLKPQQWHSLCFHAVEGVIWSSRPSSWKYAGSHCWGGSNSDVVRGWGSLFSPCDVVPPGLSLERHASLCGKPLSLPSPLSRGPLSLPALWALIAPFLVGSLNQSQGAIPLHSLRPDRNVFPSQSCSYVPCL